MSRNTVTLDRDRVLALRKREGLTQEDLAGKSGCTKTAIEKAEKGKPVSLITAECIAGVFGVRSVDLFSIDEREALAFAESTTASRIGTAPQLPSIFLGRDDDLCNIRQKLVRRRAAAQVEGGQATVVVRGWPGVGKTTLTRAIAHDVAIKAEFTSGLLWASLGPKPSIANLLQNWASALSIDPTPHSTNLQLSQRIGGHLADRSMLLLIDDVWSIDDATMFLVGGRNCATLVTTRFPTIAEAYSSTPDDVHKLDVLSEDDSLKLLHALAPTAVSKHEKACRSLVKDMEFLPLALQIAGRMLRAEDRRHGDVCVIIDRLRNESQTLLASPLPADMRALSEDVPTSVIALLDLTTNLLSSLDRERYTCLPAFAPKPAIFQLPAAVDVWECSIESARESLNTLIDLGLVEPVEGGKFQVHQVLIKHAEYLSTQPGG